MCTCSQPLISIAHECFISFYVHKIRLVHVVLGSLTLHYTEKKLKPEGEQSTHTSGNRCICDTYKLNYKLQQYADFLKA